MCFLELCESNYKEIQLLCQVVILLPEKNMFMLGCPGPEQLGRVYFILHPQRKVKKGGPTDPTAQQTQQHNL
jgi:hypothetical protein